MNYYERVLMRVNGALAAHFNKTLPERHKEQMLGFVYSMKYEYQQRFDKMEVVGHELQGKVEAVLTPTGFVKRVRLNPSVANMPEEHKKSLIVSAVSKAKRKGRALMQDAEMQVYGHFLRDLKPWLHGIRDNPEFFTIPEDAVETPAGILAPSWLRPEHIHRTIPFTSWENRGSKQEAMDKEEADWLKTEEGWSWQSSTAGQRYVQSLPENRARGAPGRLMKDDYGDHNVAYTKGRKDDLDEVVKTKTLFDMWMESPSTAVPKAGDYDRVLGKIVNKDIELRAARVDWTVTRADDRAKARRDAQDRGLEPHYQNFHGFDLKKHWHVNRRKQSAAAFYDYDVVKPSSVDATRPVQHSGLLIGGWKATKDHTKEEWARWCIARDVTRTPVGQEGNLEECFTAKEPWQSKYSMYPEAQGNFN
eukprot:TRINITY_DN13710_c0_g1_i2.p1 TRINITY_DN13710_c0_g1~~TRINITY_DN13710_c0_g1_i2.p1  ORF type:complete len:419 (+),score=137.16 TRINITY_DN13710_c0_g1_i2:64-1320(+)